MISRRRFLTTSVTAVAGVTLSSRLARAMANPLRQQCIPLTAAVLRSAPDAWIPNPFMADAFRALALAAMDAARQARVEFADIRLSVQRSYGVDALMRTGVDLSSVVGYTVRVRQNGTWSAKHGTELTTDAVVAAARAAAATAATTAALNARIRRAAAPELAPAPVVTGEWRGPCEIDPFTVPIDDAVRLLSSWSVPSRRMGNVGMGGAVTWQAQTSVFASTTGSLVTQDTMRAFPAAGASAWLPQSPTDVVGVPALGVDPVSAGFEAILPPDIPDRLVVAAEEAIRLRQLPLTQFKDVGRYPIMFSGLAFTELVGQTLNPALDGDRLAGLEADASGRTFLAPASAVLGAPTPAFSPLLTLTAHRAAPSPVAVQWDDDGIVPTPYTLIDRGRVVDYHTTRETAPVLSDWYRQRGVSMRSHGDAVAMTPTGVPVGGSGHLTVAPATTAATEDDLVRGMSHGFWFRGGSADASPALSLVSYRTTGALEIRNGKPVARVFELWLSLASKTIFNAQLTALGDARTLRTQMVGTPKGMPWQELMQPVTAPAAHCKDVDVVPPYQNR